MVLFKKKREIPYEGTKKVYVANIDSKDQNDQKYFIKKANIHLYP